MFILNGFKLVLGWIISSGINAIVKNAVKSTTPAKIGKFKKFAIWIGSMALSLFISDKVVKHTNEKIDEQVKEFNDIKAEVKRKQELLLVDKGA